METNNVTLYAALLGAIAIALLSFALHSRNSVRNRLADFITDLHEKLDDLQIAKRCEDGLVELSAGQYAGRL